MLGSLRHPAEALLYIPDCTAATPPRLLLAVHRLEHARQRVADTLAHDQRAALHCARMNAAAASPSAASTASTISEIHASFTVS